jgi:hypothetical protein
MAEGVNGEEAQMLDFTQMEDYLSKKIRGEILESVKFARLQGATEDWNADHSTRVDDLHQQMSELRSSLMGNNKQDMLSSIRKGGPNTLLQESWTAANNSEQVLRVESLQAQLTELKASFDVGARALEVQAQSERNPVLELPRHTGFHSHQRPSCLSPGLAAVLWKEGQDEYGPVATQPPNKWDIMSQVWTSQGKNVPDESEQCDYAPGSDNSTKQPARDEHQCHNDFIPPMSERMRWIRKHSQNRSATVPDQERWIREHLDWREVSVADCCRQRWDQA